MLHCALVCFEQATAMTSPTALYGSLGMTPGVPPPPFPLKPSQLPPFAFSGTSSSSAVPAAPPPPPPPHFLLTSSATLSRCRTQAGAGVSASSSAVADSCAGGATKKQRLSSPPLQLNPSCDDKVSDGELLSLGCDEQMSDDEL